MRRSHAIVSTLVFAVLAPGSVLVLIPLLITRADPGRSRAWGIAAGLALLSLGLFIGLTTMTRFVIDGRGTPAPYAAPVELVVTGLFRYVRNPMYLGIVMAISGEALVLDRPLLFTWAAGFWLIVAVWVRYYEQPALRRQFGDQYLRYCESVRAWIPRLHPWRAPISGT